MRLYLRNLTMPEKQVKNLSLLLAVMATVSEILFLLNLTDNFSIGYFLFSFIVFFFCGWFVDLLLKLTGVQNKHKYFDIRQRVFEVIMSFAIIIGLNRTFDTTDLYFIIPVVILIEICLYSVIHLLINQIKESNS